MLAALLDNIVKGKNEIYEDFNNIIILVAIIFIENVIVDTTLILIRSGLIFLLNI